MLAACAGPVGSTSVRDVAWVATDASVTLPGMDVTPVNLTRRHVQAKVTVGSLPSALAYTPGGKDLLVVTQGDDQLHEIDTATHQVLRAIGVGVEPDAVAVAPGGTDGKGVALVANLDSNSVTPVDLGTWRAGKPIAVGSEPVAIAVSVVAAGAATAFVADYGSNTVTPIDVGHAAARGGHCGRPRAADHRRRAGGGAGGQLRQSHPHRGQPDGAAGGRHHCPPAEPDRHRRRPVGCHWPTSAEAQRWSPSPSSA